MYTGTCNETVTSFNSDFLLYTVWVQNFIGLKFRVFAETLLLLNFVGFDFRGFVMGVIIMLFSDYSCVMVLVDQ